jgi:[acyl-carrier-protein] S-malonyltransferase
MNCFMFPGQPLSCSTALPDDADFAEIAELVRRKGHFDLASCSWRDAQGTDQVKLQLSGVAESLHRLRQLRHLGVHPALVAQHSMGIYPALVACGCLPEAQAIEITWRVGSCLAGMGMTRRYALGCVIGLSLEPLRAVARNNRVHLANHNTSRHFLLSGGEEEMALAMAEALEAGAFSARSFGCDAPLHTPLVAQLEQELGEIFADYRYAEPAFPLMDHLDQSYLSAARLPGFMLRELQLPVYWERTYRALRAAGAAKFFEVGRGESLKKYNRWIEAEIGAEAP